MAKKELSFEEAMTRLETIVTSMELGKATLEESLGLFKEGTELLAQCNALLDMAEQQVTKLTQSGDGGLREVPFQVPGND